MDKHRGFEIMKITVLLCSHLLGGCFCGRENEMNTNNNTSWTTFMIVVAIILSACGTSTPPALTQNPTLISEPTQTLTPISKPTLFPINTPPSSNNYTIPHWISLKIPDDWYSIRPNKLGWISLSNKDVDFPYFKLEKGVALVMLFEYSSSDQSPMEILEIRYLPSLKEDRKIIEKPKSITLNESPAATARYTSPHSTGTAIEQITIVNDQGRSIAFLSIALENEFDQFDLQFSEMMNSLRIYPIAPSPDVQDLAGKSPDNYLLYKDEDQGFSFYYPTGWDVVNEESLSECYFIKPPDVETFDDSLIGPAVIIGPDVMKAFGVEGYQEELEPYLYNILMGYGLMTVHDVQVTNIPEIEKIGSQEYIAVLVGATDEGIPISGIFAVVKREDRVLGFFTWMYDLDKHILQVETILSSIILDPGSDILFQDDFSNPSGG